MASLQQKRKKEPEEEVQDTSSVPDNNTSSHHAHKTRRNYSKLLKTLRNVTSASHEDQQEIKTEPDKEQQEKTKSVSDKGTSKADAPELHSTNKNGVSATKGKHKVKRPVKRKHQEVVTLQEETNSSPDSSGGYVLKLALSMADKNATEASESQPDPQDQVNLLFHVTMTEEISNQPVNDKEEKNSDSEDDTNSSITSDEEAMSTSEEEKDDSGEMSVDSDLLAEDGDERLYRYVYSSGRKVIRGLNTRYTELNDLLYMQREICGENSGPPHTTTPKKDGQGGRSKGISHKDGQQGRSTSKGVSSGVAARTGERTGSKTKKMSSTVARLLPEKAADSGTQKGEESCPKTLLETVLEQTGLNMEDFVEEQYNPLIPYNPVLERRTRQYNCKHCSEHSYTQTGIITHIALQHRALLVQKQARLKDGANITGKDLMSAGKSGTNDGKQGRVRYKCSLCKRSRNIKSFFAMRAHLRDKHHVSQHFERCCTILDETVNIDGRSQQPDNTRSSDVQPSETTNGGVDEQQTPSNMSPSEMPPLEGGDTQQTNNTRQSEMSLLETTKRADAQQPIDDTSPSETQPLETMNRYDAQQPTDNTRPSDLPPLETTDSRVDVQQPIATDSTSSSEMPPSVKTTTQQPTDKTSSSEIPPLEITKRVDGTQQTPSNTDHSDVQPLETIKRHDPQHPTEYTNSSEMPVLEITKRDNTQQTPDNISKQTGPPNLPSRVGTAPESSTAHSAEQNAIQNIDAGTGLSNSLSTHETSIGTPSLNSGSATMENQLPCVKMEPPDKEQISWNTSLQSGTSNRAGTTLIPPEISMDTTPQVSAVTESQLKLSVKMEPPDTEQIHWNTNLHTGTSNRPDTPEASMDTTPQENAVTENQLKVSVKTEPPDTMEQIHWNASLQTGTSKKAYVKTEQPETVEHIPDNTSLQLETDASNGAASTALMPPETMPQERTVMEYQKACVKTEPPDTWEHVPENRSQLRKDSSNAGIQKSCVKTEPPDSNKVGTALIPPKKSMDNTTPAKHQVVMKFFCNLCQADIGSTLHSDITSHLQSHQITALTGSSFLRAQLICENVCGRPGTVGTREQTPDSVTLQTSTSDVPPRVSSIPTTLHHISDAERASEQTSHNTSGQTGPPNMRQNSTTHPRPATMPPVREYLSYIPSAPQRISDRERTVTVNPPQASGPEPVHVGRPLNTCSQSKEHMKQNSTTRARPETSQKHISKQVTPVPMPPVREPLTYSTGEERAVSVNPLQASGAQPVHIQSRQLYTCCLCKEHVNIKGYAAMKFHLHGVRSLLLGLKAIGRRETEVQQQGKNVCWNWKEKAVVQQQGKNVCWNWKEKAVVQQQGKNICWNRKKEGSSATTGKKRLLGPEREGSMETTGKRCLLELEREGSSATTGKKRRVEREEFCNKANRKRLSSYFPALAANTTSNSKAPETRQETRQPTCTPVSNSQSSHTGQNAQEVQPMAPVEGDVTVSTSSSTWVPPVDAGTNTAPLLSRLPSRMTADLRSSYQVYECSICSSQYRYFSSILDHAQRQHNVSVMGSFTKYIRRNVVTVGKPAHQFAGYPQKAASTPAQTQESTGPGTTSSFPGYTKKSASDSKSAATISELLKKSAVTGAGKMAHQFAGYPQKGTSTPAQTQESTATGQETIATFSGYTPKPAYDRSATTIVGLSKKSAVTGAGKVANQFAGYPQKGTSTPAQTKESTGQLQGTSFPGYTPKPAYDRSAATVAGLSKKSAVVLGAERKENPKRKESPKREQSAKRKQIALDDNPKPTVVKSEESNRHKKNSSNSVKTEQKDQSITQLAPNSDFVRSEESNRYKKSTEPSSNTVKTEPKDQNITNAPNSDFSFLDVTQLKEEGLRFKCASPCNNVWNSWEELTTYCHSYQPSAAGQDQITLQMSWETVQTFFAPSEQGYECSFCYECLQEDLAGHLSSHTVPRVEVKIIKLSTA
ncbi:hypothetical protein Bbelb_061270 [Branchiostoma belcheri]|nr:hypothetical protein Bbelb_061270 [Branchiostoma belcheri]